MEYITQGPVEHQVKSKFADHAFTFLLFVRWLNRTIRQVKEE